MQEMNLKLESYWGGEVNHRYFTSSNDSLVVHFPGVVYPCEMPLLYYSVNTALECDYDVISLEYGYYVSRVDLRQEDMPILVEECLNALKEVDLSSYKHIIFTSKSLGTWVAGEVSKQLEQYPISHVFLTPIPSTIPVLQTSIGMVIVGMSDPLFNQDHIKRIEGNPQMKIVTIPDADHALEVNQVKKSMEIMKQIVDMYEDFYGK